MRLTLLLRFTLYLAIEREELLNSKNKIMKKNSNVVGKRWYLFLLFFIFTTQISQSAFSQEKKITFSLKNASLKEIISEIRKTSDYDFVYRDVKLESFARRDVSFKDATVEQILTDCLKGTDLAYEINGKTIIIRRQAVNQEKGKTKVITGKVTDEQGNALPGVTVMIKGTSLGTATGADGEYRLEIPGGGEQILVFSFIGMKSQEIPIGSKNQLDVRLSEDSEHLEDVIVTGYFNKSKESFTGAVTSVKREELRKFGNVNLIEALKMVDPSFKIKENNARRSDPNSLPDFFVRGESSFMGNSNIPTFIVDGYEVTLQRVFDMDMERIESLTILKDASATILYGSRAANGVVVIETRRPASGKFTISYSNRTSLSVADLSDYDLMNAKEKLAYEQKAKLFDYTSVSSMEIEEYIKANVSKGVNTDWLAQPVRNAVSHSHSLYLEGGSDAVIYGLGANYNRNNGVMKKSYREVLGLSFDLTYRVREKINIRNSFEFSQTKVQNSPYGSFADYAAANPYNPIYGEDGKLVKTYPVHTGLSKKSSDPQYKNPIYNSTLPYKDEESIQTITDNLKIDYFFTPTLRLMGSISLTKTLGTSDKYLSPEHTSFSNESDAAKKGSYKQGMNKRFSYNINTTLNYTLNVHKHTLFSGVGLNVVDNQSSSSSFEATGFMDERFNEIQFAATYLDGGKPKGSEGTDRMVGFFGNINYSYDNRYFADFSGRLDGSSKYGKDKRFAPLWSVGIGLNLNNESFLKEYTWLSRLTVRGSMGLTGNQNFDPYVARTTLAFKDGYYYQSLGASFITYGNDKLEWQRSKKRNIGLDLEVMQRRLTIRFDYYNDLTSGLLLPVSVAPSLGFSSYTENFGEQRNTGYEFDVNAVIIRKKNLDWAVNISGTHNENSIEKISNALRSLNDETNALESDQTKAIAMYEEGESLNAIKVVRSLGINPANGKELYQTRDGKITEEWNYQDKIVAGCTDAKLEGNIGTNVIWKNFSLNLLFNYGFGGQIYNSTLAERVEGADPTTNADKRVLEERWQEVGDYTFYKNIADRTVSKASSRFVQDNDYLELSNISISYRFASESLKKFGISALRLGLNSSNLFYASTVKRERGIEYPFARQFTFSLNLNF